MQTVARLIAGLLAAVLALGAGAAEAQRAGDPCQGRRVLGVSRTVEIDATGGPRFGHQQYKDLSFLADGEVVLTFDDGPLRAHTRAVLDALSAHCTRATFFVVGQMAVSDPEMVREMVRRGHTIGTHTFTHRNLRTAGIVQARHEIELGFSAVQKAAGTPIAPFFRFPFLADSTAAKSYLQSRNLAAFSIEIDAYDYRAHAPEVVHRNVMSQLAAQRKGIILFHDIQPSTAGALKGLLDELAARQYRVVHLVPKQVVVTLPAFDALAERELSRRRSVVASQPLAPRSVVWPISPPASVTIGVAQPAAPGGPLPAGAAPPLAPQAPGLAGQQPPALPQPGPVERPSRRLVSEPSWQDRAFGTQ